MPCECCKTEGDNPSRIICDACFQSARGKADCCIKTQAKNERLKEEIIAAIEILEIGIINSQTGIPLWESVESVQYNLEQALKGKDESI